MIRRRQIIRRKRHERWGKPCQHSGTVVDGLFTCPSSMRISSVAVAESRWCTRCVSDTVENFSVGSASKSSFMLKWDMCELELVLVWILNIVWIWGFRLLSWIDCLVTRATWNASLDASTCAFVFLKEPWALLGKVVTNVLKFQADIKVQVKFDWLTSSILCRSMDWCGPERRLALKYLWLQDTSIASRLSSTSVLFRNCLRQPLPEKKSRILSFSPSDKSCWWLGAWAVARHQVAWFTWACKTS